MRDMLDDAAELSGQGERVAVAMVVDTRRSAPRPLGSRLFVTESGEMRGSVSGGCVESDVVLRAQEVLRDGTPALVQYGITDDDAFDVGLPCGGEIEVFIAPFDADEVARVRQAVDGDERLSDADEIVVGWPAMAYELHPADEATYVVVLTHDARFDEPALGPALRSPAAYIGALGSRRAQDKRRERLLNAGYSEADLTRISGPLGLDIGAITPAETAVSILAEVLAVRAGRSGGRLSQAPGRIHPEAVTG